MEIEYLCGQRGCKKETGARFRLRDGDGWGGGSPVRAVSGGERGDMRVHSERGRGRHVWAGRVG